MAPGTPKKPALISVDVVRRATPHRALAYDKNKDMHYDVISAFIKSMRGSDPDAALYWLARMIDGGEDPKFIARRMMIQASEDVGNADPQAFLIAEAAFKSAEVIGYPVIVRPAFTMGGTGGGICENKAKLIEIGTNGLRLSPIHQILVEKCIAGWKEIEYEVMRDHKGNVITVCNMENLDPVGIHTGDSVVVAPSQTLSDHEYQMLRTAALDIITELGIEGGCNCQFALKPDSFDYAVIEVNPRVSRSSALASKATGYPIAKVATKIAIGYTLDEITNDVTGKTCACFEPALDYIVVKYPKWPFDKFVYADKSLGTQMMATGEVMSIGNSFEAAMMKAVSSIELGMDTLTHKPFEELSDDEIVDHMHVQDAERVFCVYEALKRGIDHETIYRITKIDWWFLDKMQHLADLEKGLAKCEGVLSEAQYKEAKKYGFQDKTIKRLAKVDKLSLIHISEPTRH